MAKTPRSPRAAAPAARVQAKMMAKGPAKAPVKSKAPTTSLPQIAPAGRSVAGKAISEPAKGPGAQATPPRPKGAKSGGRKGTAVAAKTPLGSAAPAAIRRPDDFPITALALAPAPLDAPTQAYFDKCVEKLGFVPNVLSAYAFDQAKLSAFSAFYNDLMLAPSGLSKLEREMVAVVVSSINRCYYCLTAHGAAVRALSGDPILGEQMVMNYRAARLDARQRAMLDFAAKLTETPHLIEEDDRAALRRAGLSDRDIFDLSAVAAFFNMTNRVASATDMRPNEAYHAQSRTLTP